MYHGMIDDRTGTRYGTILTGTRYHTIPAGTIPYEQRAVYIIILYTLQSQNFRFNF
jgi:hypothetical protein